MTRQGRPPGDNREKEMSLTGRIENAEARLEMLESQVAAGIIPQQKGKLLIRRTNGRISELKKELQALGWVKENKESQT